MEKHMKGEFYLLAAFLVGMYLFFLMQIFSATKTSFETPDIPQVSYLLDTAQDALEQEGSIDIVREAMNFIHEPVGLRCSSLATGKGSCDLYEDEWACGVNVTSAYHGKMDVEITRTLHMGNFEIQTTRTPIYLQANESANLVKVSQSLSISSGTLKDTKGNTLKASWSGNTVTFRPNLVKNVPKVVYVYHTGEGGTTIHSDIGVLNEGDYDSSVLYEKLSSLRDTENISLSELSELKNGAGPAMLFIPGEYPDLYGADLLEYVAGGGLLVAPYGLCRKSGSCLTGNIEQITGSHTLTGLGDFSSLNPITTNSEYFTNPDLPWIVYNSGGTNTSRAAVGASSYGEGYVVFLGNESMLSDWDQLDEFLNILVLWGVPPVTVTKQVCPDQNP